MSAKEEFEKLPDWLKELWTLNSRLAREAEKALSSRDSTPTEGIGKRVGRQIVDVALSIHGTNIIRDEYPATLKDIENRIDRALAAPRMTLDLSGVFTFPKSGKKNGDYYLSERGVREAILAQLPNVDIIADKETP